MKVDINTLETVLTKVFQILKENEVSSVSIEDDFYWHVPQSVRYNPYVEPETQDLSLGQLSDDWQSLVDALNDDRVEYNLLKKISPLLRNIGEKVIIFDDEDSFT